MAYRSVGRVPRSGPAARELQARRELHLPRVARADGPAEEWRAERADVIAAVDMIYAAVFDALPAPAKDAIYQRMWQILSGAEKDGKYARLALDDRRAIVDILRETKAGLPDYFGAVAE